MLVAAPSDTASEFVLPLGSPAGWEAIAIDPTDEPGRVAFEIPAGLGGKDIVLIVSSTAFDGPYRGRCAVGPGDGTLPDLFASGHRIDLDDVPLPAGGPGPPSDLVDFVADRGAPQTASRRPPLRRAFAVQSRPGDPASPSNYDLVDARLRALGERIQIFVDEDDLQAVSDDALRNLVSCFDRVIEPDFAGWIGRPLDVDRDGRLSVLMSSRVGLPYAGRCHVDGYFRSADLDPALPRPLSNRADLIYLNARLRPGPYLETILAHEYAHAVLDSRRRERAGPTREEAWIDEAMAHLCEDRVGRSAMNLDYRVAAFLAEPGRYRLVVDDEHRPGFFRSHGNRGAGYLFLRWCAEAFDPDLPRTLALGGETGLANLERATGLPFDELHRRWTIELALASLGPSREFARGLDLLDRLGDWPLGGVRFVDLGPGESAQPFAIEGTGTRFLRLPTLQDGPTRVELRCDPGAAIRATALVPAGRLPRVAIELEVVEAGPESVSVVARLEECAGLPMQVDRLCWEPTAPGPDRARESLAARKLTAEELTAILPEPNLGAWSSLTIGPFPVPIEEIHAGPLAFRLSARAADGQRAVAWADLRLRPTPGRSTRDALVTHLGPPDATPAGPSP